MSEGEASDRNPSLVSCGGNSPLKILCYPLTLSASLPPSRLSLETRRSSPMPRQREPTEPAFAAAADKHSRWCDRARSSNNGEF